MNTRSQLLIMIIPFIRLVLFFVSVLSFSSPGISAFHVSLITQCLLIKGYVFSVFSLGVPMTRVDHRVMGTFLFLTLVLRPSFYVIPLTARSDEKYITHRRGTQ
jgi:hypothetical protein